ncbi:serine hydrolase domain-containing protein [Streptomyces sp. 549]|uniref:serine hydrolase domain-containing protein n=1 Tax=Streptomyces sp. 549 TaxID=3049076 RepID=UPI0024C436B5|nr:serine hydrolase domain-containing protein [Streptomyces sp. 549]MDK1473552.1 serine hydrolase domain-containing protein [Streptomyces sp. 549]
MDLTAGKGPGRRAPARAARAARTTTAAVCVGAMVAAGLLATGATAHGADAGGAQLRLQRDADAVRHTGATGLLVEVRDAAGRTTTARSGVADLRRGGPVPQRSYYRIGSDTKTMVAVVALQLVAEGALSLDDTVERRLPGVVAGNGNDGSRVTLRNLLQHTSGLTDYTDILFEDPEKLTPAYYREHRFSAQTPGEQVALAMTRAPGWLPDADDPGSQTRWAYSNTNYVLAGMIIERVTGRPWEHAVHERIVEPLGLRRTMSMGTSAYVPRPTASGYTQFPGRRGLTDTTVSVGGGADGGVVSTAADMNVFLRALMGGDLLPPAQLAQMRTTVPAPVGDDGGPERYGLGIAWRPAPGCADGVWYHGGTSFGTVSETAVTPDGRASAAAAVFTTRFGDEKRFLEQAAASIRLVDRAVCAKRR